MELGEGEGGGENVVEGVGESVVEGEGEDGDGEDRGGKAVSRAYFKLGEAIIRGVAADGCEQQSDDHCGLVTREGDGVVEASGGSDDNPGSSLIASVVKGRTCADFGAAPGGWTQLLAEHDAAKVG